MDSRSTLKLKARDKPLLIFDGACRFCYRWVHRWKSMTGSAVDYEPFQELTDEFPEIGLEAFSKSIHLIETDGSVRTGAGAVFRFLAPFAITARICHHLYDHFAWLAKMAEFVYTLVARYRTFFSLITRMLWGNNPEPSTYKVSLWLFPRTFGMVVLCAVLSYGLQFDGLIGPNGILPVGDFLERIKSTLESQGQSDIPWMSFPTLFWFSHAPWFVQTVFALTGLAALSLVFGFVPPLASFIIFCTYLSLSVIGQVFFTFQWDILLVEIAFLTTLASRWTILDRLNDNENLGFPKPARWLIVFLLFRLMFESGIVKIQSFGSDGGNSWRDFTALNFHYWSQPIPSLTSWYVDKLPFWIDVLSIKIMLIIELILPFFFFAPRMLRNIAFLAQVLLQVLIMATGNYGFFNLLTLVLCLPLVDDQTWVLLFPKTLIRFTSGEKIAGRIRGKRWGRAVQLLSLVLFSILALPIGLFQIWHACGDTRNPNPASIWIKEHPFSLEVFQNVNRLHLVNGYGLFRVMTTTRPEIVISGSEDGNTWKNYEFKFKRTNPSLQNRFFIPHMPRLDWRLWFAGLNMERTGRPPSWLTRFFEQILKGNATVLALLGKNPFLEKPPRYVRLQLYHYTFSDNEEQRETGHWWNTKLLPSYTMQFSLKPMPISP